MVEPPPLDDLQRAVDASPDDAHLRLELVKGLMEWRRHVDAHEQAKVVLQMDPEDPDVITLLAEIKYRMFRGGYGDHFADELRELLDRAPQVPTLSILRVEMDWAQGTTSGALTLRRELQLNRDDRHLLEFALRLLVATLPSALEVARGAEPDQELLKCVGLTIKRSGELDVDTPMVKLVSGIVGLLDEGTSFRNQKESCEKLFAAADRWRAEVANGNSEDGLVESIDAHELAALWKWIGLDLPVSAVEKRYRRLQNRSDSIEVGLHLAWSAERSELLRQESIRLEEELQRHLRNVERVERLVEEGRIEFDRSRLVPVDLVEVETAIALSRAWADMLDGLTSKAAARLNELSPQDPWQLLSVLILRERCAFIAGDFAGMAAHRAELAEFSELIMGNPSAAEVMTYAPAVLSAMRWRKEFDNAARLLDKLEEIATPTGDQQQQIRLYIERLLLRLAMEGLDKSSAVRRQPADGGRESIDMARLDSWESTAGHDADPRSLLLLAACRLIAGDLPGAQRLVDQVNDLRIRLNRRIEAFQLRLSALISLQTGDHKEALSTVNKLRAYDRIDPGLRVLEWYLRWQKGEGRKSVIFSLETELSHRPSDLMATLVLVALLLEEARESTDVTSALAMQGKAAVLLEELTGYLSGAADAEASGELDRLLHLGIADLNIRIAVSQRSRERVSRYLDRAESSLQRLGTTQDERANDHRARVKRIRRRVSVRPPDTWRGVSAAGCVLAALGGGYIVWERFRDARGSLAIAVLTGFLLAAVALWRGLDFSRVSVAGLEMESRSLAAEAGLETPLGHWLVELLPRALISDSVERLADEAPSSSSPKRDEDATAGGANVGLGLGFGDPDAQRGAQSTR